MRPTEIEKQLYNGLHGTHIEQLTVDYLARTAEFRLQVLVPIDDSDPNSKSRFRKGHFRVTGVAFLSAEVPDPHYHFMGGPAIEVGGLLDTPSKICPQIAELQRELGNSYFFHSLFVEEWNGFVHFAGTDASFEWTED